MSRTKHNNRETGMIIASLEDREQNDNCAFHSPMSQQLCSPGQSMSSRHLIESHICIHVPLQHFLEFSALIKQSFDEATTGAIKTMRQIKDGVTLKNIFAAFCQATYKVANPYAVFHGDVTCRKTVELISCVWALTTLVVDRQRVLMAVGSMMLLFSIVQKNKKKTGKRSSYFRVS